MGNMPLTQSKAAPRLYSYAPDKMPDTPGFYTIAVKIQSQDKRLIGLTGSSVLVKLPNEVTVEDLKLVALEKGTDVRQRVISHRVTMVGSGCWQQPPV
ncbi:hypothetical protein COOONC_26324 [Cooperia oncophora]